ncbi:14053_t:CDS:2 [Funneliformis mosseae]|uniref:14053_t:CDS:1 n=1 Tax=Funneliformis mosseae TaxID=27381 RepID=A0A9N9GTL0_FUNMO|nr:14053_t:CDS:2 [Funneliformis mosseae]
MVNGNHENNENNENNENTYEENGNNIPYHLKRTYESLTRRQREIYDDFPSRDAKILYLEGLIEERKKSEIGSESEEESTKYFIVLLSSIYYLAKILIPGITMERLGILYNNKSTGPMHKPVSLSMSVEIGTKNNHNLGRNKDVFWESIATRINEELGSNSWDTIAMCEYMNGSRTVRRSRTGARYFDEFRTHFWEKPEDAFDRIRNMSISNRRRGRGIVSPAPSIGKYSTNLKYDIH